MFKTFGRGAFLKNHKKFIPKLMHGFLKAQSQKGFTLMELLVVILIIGIISVVVTAVFTETRARSRDSRRVSDIKVLHDALAMYVDIHQLYPIVTVAPPGLAINGSDAVSQVLRNEGILQASLADPKAGQEIGGEIFNYYYYTDSLGRTYTITFCLETDSVAGHSQGCNNSATY